MNNEKINLMKELRKNGNTYREIAKELNIAFHTVRYHLVEGVKEKMNQYNKKRYNSLTLEKKKEMLEKKKEYQRNYHNTKYKLDIEFRNRQIERVKNYQKLTKPVFKSIK